jgi:hypothetical protein
MSRKRKRRTISDSVTARYQGVGHLNLLKVELEMIKLPVRRRSRRLRKPQLPSLLLPRVSSIESLGINADV